MIILVGVVDVNCGDGIKKIDHFSKADKKFICITYISFMEHFLSKLKTEISGQRDGDPGVDGADDGKLLQDLRRPVQRDRLRH